MTLSRKIAITTILLSGAAAVSGCSYDRNSFIPPSATVVTEGNSRLSYTAPDDGDIYLFNRRTNEIVYSGKIEKDQSLVADPQQNQITLDGRMLSQNTLVAGDDYRVFFEPRSR